MGTSLGSLGHIINDGTSVQFIVGSSFWLCYIGLLICLIFIIGIEIGGGQRFGSLSGLAIVSIGLSVIVAVVCMEIFRQES